MPKKKEPSKDEMPQSQRFIDAARESGADESGEEFERAFKRIVRQKSDEKQR